MPDVYLNSEIGQAEDIAAGKAAILATSRVYRKLHAHCSQCYRESDSIDLCIVRDGFEHSLKNCIQSFEREQMQEVMLLVHALQRGTIIPARVLKKSEGWVIDQIGAHSPLLEHAAKKNGMLLTFAVTPDWEHDFFTFTGQTKYLPNIWGQTDIQPIENWIESWYSRHNDPIKELRRRVNVQICDGAFSANDFTHAEWNQICEILERVRKRNYAVDNKLIKPLVGYTTMRHGVLHEIRLHGKGIRILFAFHGGTLLLGGHYCYGKGELKFRDNACSSAVTRINAFAL